jgi:5'-phosphate synthase pdxT subunit
MATFSHLTIGILALQGDYALHQRQLLSLGTAVRLVKLPRDLEGLDALIMPGGESTTMTILMNRFGLREPLAEFVAAKPVYGTCAGMILLGKGIEENQSGIVPFGQIDIDVLRNGWGRQIFSFEDTISVNLNGTPRALRAAFIRAPKVTRVGEVVQVLGTYRNSPVLVSQGITLAAAFHNELDTEGVLLRYFLENLCCPTGGH